MLTEMSERELIFWALSMWLNYIETGDSTLSKQDWINSGRPQEGLRNLEPEQIATATKLDQLRAKVMAGDPI
jgi:hypothetical protein